MITPWTQHLRPFAWLFALVLLNPACKGTSTTTPAPTGTILFDDPFLTFPNANWSVTGSGVVSLNDFAGNPSPAIATSPGRSTSEASLMIETITHFGGESLTFSADMILVAEGGGTGGGSFVVRDFPGGSAIAGVTLDAQSSMLTFTIGTDVSSSMGIVPGWHTYSFTFNASGIA